MKGLVTRLRRWIDLLVPPFRWRVPVIVILGVLTGLGATIFHVSRASSYLSDDPSTCVNCHVMTPEFASWQRGSHGRVATCNDCHVPHDNAVRHYFFKAKDGSRHAYMFTFRMEPQVIIMHEAGREVVQENCIRCHEHLVGGIAAVDASEKAARHGGEKLCWDCHRSTPHGRVHSLASTPYARVPMLSPVLSMLADSLRTDQ